MKRTTLPGTVRFSYSRKAKTAILSVILLIFSTTILAQSTIYIDPTFSGSGQNGSIQAPFSSWSQVTWVNGNTYLQKKGTTFTTTGTLYIAGRNGITLGAYGEGERPAIVSSASGGRIIRFANSPNCTVRDLNISSTGTMVAQSCISVEGTSSNMLIDNCEIHSAEWGIRMPVAVGTTGYRILNTTVHNCGDDGIYAKDVKDIQVGFCHVYNINRKYLINPDQSYSAGDCIQITGNPTVANALQVNIHDNILDHSNMGNKFCLIVVGDYYSGTIERNVMTGSSSSSCIYLWHSTGSVTVSKNVLQSGVYGIYSYVNDLQVHYNKFLNNNIGISVLPSSLTRTNLTAYNNVFYNNSNIAIAMNSASLPSNFVSKNNAFYLTSSSSRAFLTSNSIVSSNNNNFNVQHGNFINNYSTLAAWRNASGHDLSSAVANPMFQNPVAGDFCIHPDSPCRNSGHTVGLPTDFFSTPVPQEGMPDIGVHELICQTGGNQSPVIGNQSFSVAENSASGTVAGQVIASDPDQGQTLMYSIISGNTGDAFAINQTSGQISVSGNQPLDFESVPVYQLTVQVQDNGEGNLTATAIITIQLTDVNELPVIVNQSFAVLSNSPVGTVAGTVEASDPDAGQQLSYSILSGNTSGAFTINASSGVISVANASVINYITNPQFVLVVRAQDNGTPVLNAQAEITVVITPVNNPPQISAQTFSVNENTVAGTIIGQVSATDPDPGQSLTYSILSGNSGNVFAISPLGQLSVAASGALDFENLAVYQLLIQVQDNGGGYLTASAVVTVNVIDLNELPVMGVQTFSVEENSATGTMVGQMLASDPDQGQSLSYSILSGNTGNAFSINSSTGFISVANASALDFETRTSYELQVQVTDNGSPVLSASATALINVLDVNETPVINNQDFEIDSNSPTGSVIGTVNATDPDAGQALSFAIVSGNTSGAFAINNVTGVLTVANSQAVNYLINPQFSLVVSVADNGTPSLTSQATITIVVNPVNNAPQIIAQSFTIAENSPSGTIAGVVSASDPDPGQSLSFTISQGNTGNAFSITQQGAVVVSNASVLDFESIQSFYLTVAVTDNGVPSMSSSAIITVVLTDINEAPTVLTSQVLTVQEHSPVGTQLGAVQATDPDNGQSLGFSIVGGNTNNAFAINASTGVISTTNFVCYEYCSSYQLVIKVVDNGNPVLSDQAVVLINIGDINERPVISPQSFQADAFSASGTNVGLVLAADPDHDQTLTFSITGGNTSDAFIINSVTGQLLVNNSSALNNLINPSFAVMVKVEDNGNPSLSASAVMTIVLVPVNESPVMSNQMFDVQEGSAQGTTVGQIVATDPDAGQTLSYELINGNTNNAFAISTSGLITVNNPDAINYNQLNQFVLTVAVTDNGQPVLSAEAQMTINVIDANDPPVILPQSYSYVENAPNGRYICQILASDEPGDTYQFYLIGGNTQNAFWLQAYTGRLFVNNSAALDFETNPVFNLTVRVVDNHGAYSEGIVTIRLFDVNESPIVTNQSFMAYRPSTNGTAVGTVQAADPDAGQSLLYFIHSGNTSNIFKINMNTGVITINNASAFNNSSTRTYNLQVRVRDNGSPALSSYAYMTINVVRTKDSDELVIEETKESVTLDVVAYPNPSANGLFYVKTPEFTNVQADVKIVSLTGQVIQQMKLDGNTENLVDLSHLATGIYMMQVVDGDRSLMKKLIRQ